MRDVATALRVLFVVCCCALAPARVALAQRGFDPATLRGLTLEELGSISVTSVSRAEEDLAGAAAAVAVITSEDIRRSGATTVPDVLRLAPGLHVARQTANVWAMSARGFSTGSSEKLLVLADTRSIYTPLFAGVLWDAQDMLLDDIERIEVIRGPGASLWGSNAVNGVINITTKHARDTQGLYATTRGGSEERLGAAARYGGRLGNTGFYRVFGSYADRGSSFTAAPATRRDDWQIGHAGVRLDWDLGAAAAFTLQGKAYGADTGRLSPSVMVTGRPSPAGPLRTNLSGGHVLARWTRRPSARSDLQFRVYYDRTHRNDPSFVDDLDTIDLDVQHRAALPRLQEITWGANYRFTSNHNVGKGVFAVDPSTSQDHLVAGFVQHQVQLGDRLQLTSGTKLEHNDFSGAELQPSVRAGWDVTPEHTVWGAVSRAARIPTRLERDIAIDVTPPGANPAVRLLGNPEFDAEELVAIEGGYRWQDAAVLVDVAAYHNRYTDLASLERGALSVDASGRITVPIVNENLTDGTARGYEAVVTFVPVPRWRLSASSTGTWLEIHAHGRDLNRGVTLEGSTPRHQFGLRSMLDLGEAIMLDAHLRHLTDVRTLPSTSTGEGVDGYAELDVRLAWQATRAFEFAVVGQSLLHARHAEFGSAAARGEVQRAVYAAITLRR